MTDNNYDKKSASIREIDDIHDILGQWLRFAEMQIHTLGALRLEITRTSTLVEDSAIDLSQRFRQLVDISEHQAEFFVNSDAIERQHDVSEGNSSINKISTMCIDWHSLRDDRMRSSVSEIIVGLQYQDRAKQQLEHVIDSLNMIAVGLGELTDRTHSAAPEVISAQNIDWFDQLLTRFTLSDLRERFVRRLMMEGIVVDDHSATGPPTECGTGVVDDITLF